MKSIKEQIRDHDIGRLYLLFGEERYLVEVNCRRLKEALLEPEDELMNYDKITGATDVDTIKASSETLPMMAERRVVLLKDTGAFSGGASYAGLEDYFADIPETSVVIFVESEVDKRSRMYKQLSKHGQAIEMKRLEENDLIRWMEQELKKNKIASERSELAYMLSLTGNDMTRIDSELQKLISYVKETGRLSKNDVDQIVSPTIEAKIFKLTDLLGEGKKGKAYQTYHDLVLQAEPVQRIFYMIIRQFRLLYRAALLIDDGKERDVSLACRELGVQSFVARNCLSQAKRFGSRRLAKILSRLLELDAGSKSGKITAEDAVILIVTGDICDR